MKTFLLSWKSVCLPTCPQSSQGYSESTCHEWGHSGDRPCRWDTLLGSSHRRNLWSRAGHTVSHSSLCHRWCNVPLSPYRAVGPCSAHTCDHPRKTVNHLNAVKLFWEGSGTRRGFKMSLSWSFKERHKQRWTLTLLWSVLRENDTVHGR